MYFTKEAFCSYTEIDPVTQRKKNVPSNIANIINNASCFENGYKIIIGRKKSQYPGIKYTMQCRESQEEKKSKAKIRSTHTELPDKEEDLASSNLSYIMMRQ